MKICKIALLAFTISFVACGGGGSSSSGDWITITDAYFTPNPVAVGETASLLVYIESASDCANIKWVFLDNSQGEHAEVPATGNSCNPPEWRTVVSDVEVTGEPGERWVTFWFIMADGTERAHLTVNYTVTE